MGPDPLANTSFRLIDQHSHVGWCFPLNATLERDQKVQDTGCDFRRKIIKDIPCDSLGWIDNMIQIIIFVCCGECYQYIGDLEFGNSHAARQPGQGGKGGRIDYQLIISQINILISRTYLTWQAKFHPTSQETSLSLTQLPITLVRADTNANEEILQPYNDKLLWGREASILIP